MKKQTLSKLKSIAMLILLSVFVANIAVAQTSDNEALLTDQGTTELYTFTLNSEPFDNRVDMMGTDYITQVTTKYTSLSSIESLDIDYDTKVVSLVVTKGLENAKVLGLIRDFNPTVNIIVEE